MPDCSKYFTYMIHFVIRTILCDKYCLSTKSVVPDLNIVGEVIMVHKQ